METVETVSDFILGGSKITSDGDYSHKIKRHLLLGRSSVQSLGHVQLFATPWTEARQASLYITNSQSPPKPMSIESVMPYNHLILCHPLFLLPSIFHSTRVFSKELALRIRWPKYWSFSFRHYFTSMWDEWKEEKWKAKEKRKDISIWMQSSKE